MYQEMLKEAKSNILIKNMVNNLMNAIEIKVKKEEGIMTKIKIYAEL